MTGLNEYLGRGRWLLLLLLYGGLCSGSLWLAYELRFDFNVPVHFEQERLAVLWWVVSLKMVFLFSFGQFNVFLTYFRLPDLYRILGAVVVHALFLLYMRFVFDEGVVTPRGVILTDMMVSLGSLCAFRVGLRVYRERYLSDSFSGGRRVPVVIVGAGDAGASLASDLLSRRGIGLRPVAFLDDNASKHGKDIHGVPVLGAPERLPGLVRNYGIERVILALPSASRQRIAAVVAMAREAGVVVEIVPSLGEMVTGKVRASQIRPVEIEDLLGRDMVHLESDRIAELLRGQVVMVTGAGGSIGSELCRQIASAAPARLLMLDRSEGLLFQSGEELMRVPHETVVTPLVADITDAARMRAIFGEHRPQIVFHAAAHKHVPMMESQPCEALRNNSLGTAALAQWASEFGVARFVAISTDKAVNPTSVMGASKRLAEILVQAAQVRPGNKTEFMAVRFGNVLGSSGSVVPIFKKQIALGGPVTVTHPEVTRYFMTVGEAVGLVLQCALIGRGGDILVLDMGQPVKIVDLARQLIELSGFRPEVDIPLRFSGLRPGEKLYEEVCCLSEWHAPTAHPSISRFLGPAPDAAASAALLERLRAHVETLPDVRDSKHFIQGLVPEYTPHLD